MRMRVRVCVCVYVRVCEDGVCLAYISHVNRITPARLRRHAISQSCICCCFGWAVDSLIDARVMVRESAADSWVATESHPELHEPTRLLL
jgi:hypothetical protein